MVRLAVGLLSLGAILALALTASFGSRPGRAAQADLITLSIDRGNGALYREGEPITICVALHFDGPNIYMVSAFPVRVLNSVENDPAVVIWEGTVDATGQECFVRVMAPPFGRESIVAEVFDPINGGRIAWAEAHYVSAAGRSLDFAGLVDALRAAGAMVEPRGELVDLSLPPERRPTPLLHGFGWRLRVNGADLIVYEYPDEAAADADAAIVGPDGSSFGNPPTIMVSWIDRPHFYKSGRAIVQYVGSDPEVLRVLESVLGPQFAGM